MRTCVCAHVCARCRWLKEGEDGLFRPQPVFWEERPSALVNIRTQVRLLVLCDGQSNMTGMPSDMKSIIVVNYDSKTLWQDCHTFWSTMTAGSKASLREECTMTGHIMVNYDRQEVHFDKYAGYPGAPASHL